MDRASRWAAHYDALLSFTTREGHSRVPAAHEEPHPGTPEPLPLGSWVSYMRQSHRAGRLPAERTAALEAVPHWEWGPFRPGPPTDTSRNAEIRAARANGMTLQQIADSFGLSRQRVHQIAGDVVVIRTPNPDRPEESS